MGEKGNAGGEAEVQEAAQAPSVDQSAGAGEQGHDVAVAAPDVISE